MCSMKGCAFIGDMVPRIVFIFDGGQHTRWEVPVIAGLPLCANCRPKERGASILSDGGAAIIDSLRRLRPGAKHVDTRLEWIALDHPDYLRLKGMGPS